MPHVPFFWVDVFAREPLTGNPLTLVPDADGLTEQLMIAIAKEFNQSETTFLVTPTAPGADYRLRSFAPGGVEVLGAGHNAMGAWIWLARSGRLPAGRTEFVQQIGDDVLAVRVEYPHTSEVRVTMRQSPPRFLGRTDDHDALEGALGLTSGALRRDVAAQVGSTGAEHLLVAAASVEAVDAAAPRHGELKDLLAAVGAEGCYLYAATPGAASTAYARFFNPTVGIEEDPATGTAAGPLAALLVRDGVTDDGGVTRIEQGRAIGRPSLLEVHVNGSQVELSGSGLVVADGRLAL
ncbi:PhzF family phenazine biosynthesis protein [Pseudonocardia sp. TMWB2A]|uniref:PhzF family phenazine biosynthesis protein n=1 Tax=Pseudonocardia sp. TMWB2A TaxID=687430 RepID=UPI00307CF140